MKSIRKRILDKAKKIGKFDSTIARKMFKTELLNDWSCGDTLHDSIMRRARELASDGLLRRSSPGQYQITTKGRKAV